ncbi:MAG: hypothetical protein JWM77_2085 [Rhodospirillales bacterium]|jgi:hypothetical protein|nr:hypothetical protein [Rhodospirillales bacterium]
MRSLVAVLVAVSLASSAARAQLDADRGSATTDPSAAIQRLLQSLPPDVAQSLLDQARTTLVLAIRQAHAEAAQSARPMPPQFRQMLAPYFPADLLATVRFTTNARSGAGLQTLLMNGNGHVAAVTVDDIIVFRGDNDAANPCLWAHELVHVQQYETLGVERFALLYATRFNEIESPAYDYEQKVCAHLKRDGAPR